MGASKRIFQEERENEFYNLNNKTDEHYSQEQQQQLRNHPCRKSHRQVLLDDSDWNSQRRIQGRGKEPS